MNSYLKQSTAGTAEHEQQNNSPNCTIRNTAQFNNANVGVLGRYIIFMAY